MKVITSTKLLAKHFSLFLVMFLFLFGSNLNFGQKRFMLNQEEAEKFKIGKRLYNKGEQLFSKGKHQKAEKSLRECLEKFPKYATADYLIARILYKRTDYNLALKHILKAKENYPYISNLGVSTQLQYYERLREQKSALEGNIRDMQQMVSRSSPTGTSGTASRTQQSEMAGWQSTLDIINDRLREPIPNPSQIPADFFYVQGNILFKMKKFKDSLDQYFQTIKIDDTHGNAYINLANLHYMARKYSKALYYLQKAESSGAKVNPDFKSAIYKALKK